MNESVINAFFNEFHGGKRLPEVLANTADPNVMAPIDEISDKTGSGAPAQDTVEKPISGLLTAQGGTRATTQLSQADIRDCCKNPGHCGESRYAETMQGFYIFYCKRSEHPAQCNMPLAERYRRHSSQVPDGKPPVLDEDGDEVIDEKDLLETEEDQNNNKEE